MSGNTGLPPGLPQRPNFNSYDEKRPDSYRPLPPPPKIDYSSQSRDPDRRPREAFQFGGSSSSNSNQSQNQNQLRGGNSYAPRTTSYRGDPPTYPRGDLIDSYRPPASDFSFRAEAPRGVDVRGTYEQDRYRPSDSTRHYNDRDRDDRRDDRRGPRRDNHPRGGQSSRGGRGGGYQGRVRRAADRPFLQTNREKTPELMPGMDEDEEHAPKFRALDDVDSDEDNDEHEEESNAEDEEGQPKKKQARTATSGAADGNSVPKWSNPDPYTALPPPDESAGKKKDVVKLIRKARVSAGHEVAKKSAETDDFISFNFDDDEKHESDEEENSHMSISSDDDAAQVLSKPAPPTGPRADKAFSHRDEVVGERPAPKADILMPVKPVKLDTSKDPELGNRKRTFDDRIKGPLPPMTPKPVPKYPAKGGITPQWRAKDSLDPTPWVKDHSMTEKMGDWLHLEIIDFFECFKPQPIEEEMRRKLIDDLQFTVGREWRDVRILPFGSYPAGLYLPTADMDLVFVSQGYLNGDYGRYDHKKYLYKFRDFLYQGRIAAPESVETITKAKVPLVKYIDRLTGLRVDVSFENNTGIVAIETFLEWKRQFPAMPILVTLIKQFLCMRGLNEPVNGGIGGFTVTCLVVSLLQHLPQVQSGNMKPEEHLGEILMEFFNMYGNLFDVATTAIQTNPPRWLSKAAANRQLYRANSEAKFCIIDPNDEGNDIAGGSRNTSAILAEFRSALVALNTRMGELRTLSFADRKNQSILGCILGGDYSSFDIQRHHLERVWQTSHDRKTAASDRHHDARGCIPPR